MPHTKQTLVLIKPDALKNSLTGYVLSQLSEYHSGLWYAGTKVVTVSTMLAEEHYEEHVAKPFFPELLAYITGQVHYPGEPIKQRVIAIVFQGPDAVAKIRHIAGPTNPHNARDERPGCVRSLGTVVPIKNAAGEVLGQRMDNLVHASATDAEAEREIKLWFKPNEIPPYMRIYKTAVCNEHYYIANDQVDHLYTEGSVCLCAPGDTVWESDLAALKQIAAGETPAVPLHTVVAKYLLNESK